MCGIPSSRSLRQIERKSRPQCMHTITYLTDNEQTQLEGLLGPLNLLDGNCFAPNIKGFPHFVTGKEGDAHALAVEVIVLFPVFGTYKVVIFPMLR